MKRLAAFLLLAVFSINLASCTTPSELYGVWYNDSQGVRNAIQFSENKEGKDVFVWAVYNIEDDSIESNTTGYYRISGDTIIFDPGEETALFELQFELEGETLVIYNEVAKMTFEKFELKDQ